MYWMLASQVIATCFLSLLMHCATACTDTVYVGTGDGHVAKSKDGGDTWSTVLNNGGIPYYSVSADGPNVYAVTTYGLAVSHNGGASWSIRNFQNGSGCDSTVVSVSVGNKRVYALIGNDFGCGRVAISSDNGDTWPIKFPLPYPPFAIEVRDIYVDGPRIYIASWNGLGYTDDMGTTWTFKNQSSGLGADIVMYVIGRGQSIYAGLAKDDALVSASEDGGRSWKTTNITRASRTVTSMYLQSDTLFVSTFGDGLSWTNDFVTWTTKTTNDGLASNQTTRIDASGSNIFLGTDEGLSISRDSGQTWVTKTTENGLPSNWITTVFVHCI